MDKVFAPVQRDALEDHQAVPVQLERLLGQPEQGHAPPVAEGREPVAHRLRVSRHLQHPVEPLPTGELLDPDQPRQGPNRGAGQVNYIYMQRFHNPESLA